MRSILVWLGRIAGAWIYAFLLTCVIALILGILWIGDAILNTVSGKASSVPENGLWEKYTHLVDQSLVARFRRSPVSIEPLRKDTSPAAVAQAMRGVPSGSEPVQVDGPGRKYGRALAAGQAPALGADAAVASTGLYSGLPLFFSETCNDQETEFDFEGHGAGFKVLLREREVVIHVTPASDASAKDASAEVLRMVFEGGVGSRPKALGNSAGEYHYLLGLRPQNWVTHAPAFPAIVYEELYPDTDLVFYGSRGRLEYLFLLGPDADPDRIRIRFPDVESLAANREGGIELPMRCGHMTHQRPQAFTTQGGQTAPSAVCFTVGSHETGLEWLPPERHKDRVIAGVFDLASYLGGSGSDQIFDVLSDAQGNAYIVGETTSPNFSQDTERLPGASDNVAAFVTKVRLADSMHLFTTFIGGRSQDRALAAALDENGTLHICGETLSSDFPVDPSMAKDGRGSTWDGWVAQLSPDGSALGRILRIGGEGHDRCLDIASDRHGQVWLAGETRSQALSGLRLESDGAPALGQFDAFVLCLDALSYANLGGLRFGGPQDDNALGIAIGTDGHVYAVGQTESEQFPESPIGQAAYKGQGDAYAVEIEYTDGKVAIVNSARLGGRNADVATSVAVSEAGTIAIVGRTASRDFPTFEAEQAEHGGGKWDGFLATINAWELLSVTFFGGNGIDLVHSVAIDSSEQIVLAGASSSTNLPALNTVQVRHAGGVWDGFVAQFFGRKPVLNWCTYVGGAKADQLYAIALDVGHNIIVGGATASSEIPTPLAFQEKHNGGGLDAVFMRFPLMDIQNELREVPGGGQPDGPAYDFFMGRYEVTCAEFVRFLNDAQINTANLRGANLSFDEDGDVWMNDERVPNRQELFTVWDSHIVYSPERPMGSRYEVTRRRSARGATFHLHPVTGVSWYGAIKYCNWLTIDTGRGADQRCYSEGTQPEQWQPIGAKRWNEGYLTASERKAWLALRGFRLPMDGATGRGSQPNPFNEFFKAACWSGVSNVVYGFGRNVRHTGDANFLDHGAVRVTETTPVGFFDVFSVGNSGDSKGNENQYGLSDLSGNVSEWLSDPGDPGSMACYGGSYMYDLPRISERFFVHPHFTDPFRGFRVVSTYREPVLTAVRIPLQICVCNEGG